jgi:mRNA interferase RelE/StbE
LTRSKPGERKPPKPNYRLAFETSALKEWQALDGSVKEPLRKLLKKRLDEPRVPGAELRGELSGCYKIKLRKQGYRLVYRVVDELVIVMVLAVDKREGEKVYDAAIDRLRGLGKAAAQSVVVAGTKSVRKPTS